MFAGRELDLVFISVLAVITVIVVSVLYSGKKSTAKLEQILRCIPETFQKKNLQVGSCVTTLHNRAGEVAFKIKEIL